MDKEQGVKPLTGFVFDEGLKKVVLVETVPIIQGVQCDVYSVEGQDFQ